MHTADRREHPDSSQAPRSRCLASPHCHLPVSVGRRFGGFDGLWLHLGPIGTETTPLAFHRAERTPAAANAGRLDVVTRASHRRFDGCSVDLFGLEHTPGGEARRYVQTVSGSRQVLWVVYAVAWRSPDGLSVDWRAPGFGFEHEGGNVHFGEAGPSAARSHEAERLFRLLDGGNTPRRGRPSRAETTGWRTVAELAIEQKDTSPNLTWATIAEARQVPIRTLMTWVGIVRDERTRGIRVLVGGDER